MSLQQFLVDLATNVDLKRRYAEDPEGTMAAAGLTPEERAAFASGDSMAVRTALGKPDNESHSQTGYLVPKGSVVVAKGKKSKKFKLKNVAKESLLIVKPQVAKLEREAAAGRRMMKKKAGKKKAGKKR